MLWQNRDVDLSEASANSGPDLPTTFGETFQAAWSRNNLYGQNYTGEADRFNALTDYLGSIKRTTGLDFAPELDYGGTAPGAGGVLTDSRSLFKQVNDKLAAAKQKNPTLDFQPMTDAEFDQAGIDKRRQADADYAAVMARPRGRGATVGAAVGGALAGAADPVNISSLALAPADSLGIVGQALGWGAIGLGAAGVSTALEAPYREAVEPGYVLSGQPLRDIAAAGLMTGATGGALRGVADVWERVLKGAWPDSVRQAGNVVSSENNIARSNVYPGVDGETAHRLAVPKAIDDMIANRPVDVSKHITPELEARAATPAAAPNIETVRTQAQAAATAAEAQRAAPTVAQPPLPFERTAAEAAAETARDVVGGNVQQIARGAGYAMPAEEAARVADKLIDASPEDAQHLLRNMQISPRQVADAPMRLEPPPEPVPTPVGPLSDIYEPGIQDAMRADLDRELARTLSGQTAADYREAGFTAEEAERLAAEHLRPYDFSDVGIPPGSVEELRDLLDRNAPLDQIIHHPYVEEILRRNKATPMTGTEEDFVNPEWRAKRVYDYATPEQKDRGESVPVYGTDNAVKASIDVAKAQAGPDGVANGKHAVIITGPPAAGKSTLAIPLARQMHAAIVDSDDVKLAIPEYQNGLGTLATHDESTVIAKEVLQSLARDGSNVVLPKIGANTKQIEEFIARLKAQDYRVDLMHMSAGVEVSSRRNIHRMIRTGRLVEPDYVTAVADKTRPSAYFIRGRGEISDFADIDTSGTAAILREGEGPLAGLVRTGRYIDRADDRGVAGIGAGESQRFPVPGTGFPAAIPAQAAQNLSPIEHALPNGVAMFAPDELGVDAPRMQFKSGADEAGVTDRLRGVKTWDPIKAGMVLAWVDKDGKAWIVDGHQRLALAKRIAEEDPTQKPQLMARVLKETDGITAEQARAIAAMKNISEGTGTAVDAAKVIRDQPQLAGDLPPRSELVRQARGLVNLSPDAFGMVVNEVVPPNYAAIVGRLMPGDPAKQSSLLNLLAKTDPANAVQAEAIVRQGIEAGFAKANAGAQGALFGDEEVAESLFSERAKVLDRSLKTLRRDKTVFNTLVKERETLAEAGNQLAHEINQQRATADGQAIQILQTLANRAGPISDALRTAAAAAKSDGYAAATRQFVETVRQLSASGDLARLANGIDRGASHVGNESTASTIDHGIAAEPVNAERAEHAEQQVKDAMQPTGAAPMVTEPGAEGLPQGIMPGMEPSARQLAAARAGPLRPQMAQAAPGGLFVPPEEKSLDMFPVNIDAGKNVSYQPLSKMTNELDMFKTVAEQMAACAGPAAEAA